jgi:hypothetical protein
MRWRGRLGIDQILGMSGEARKRSGGFGLSLTHSDVLLSRRRFARPSDQCRDCAQQPEDAPQ